MQTTPEDKPPLDQLPPHILNMLRTDTDHYYQAELQNETRANFLLALASTLAALNVASLRSVHDGALAAEAYYPVVGAFIASVTAMVLAIFALWPLQGKRGDLWPAKERECPHTPEHLAHSSETALTVAHYAAHRRRCDRKSVRVVRTILATCVALVLTLVAALNSFTPPRTMHPSLAPAPTARSAPHALPEISPSP